MGPGDLWLDPTPGLTYPGTESALPPLGLIPAADRAELKLWFTSFTDPGARDEADLYESSGFLSPTTVKMSVLLRDNPGQTRRT